MRRQAGSVSALCIALVYILVSEIGLPQTAARVFFGTALAGLLVSWIILRRSESGLDGRAGLDPAAKLAVDEADVTYRGIDWGEPLHTVELRTLNMSVDVHAYSEEEARNKAALTVSDEIRRRGSRSD